eukprot:GHVQ01018322.1.p1 GENE.GHVQ01018322.1~~GHVQ01018322.1.p1  ORF type:complete len:611 (+),score=139.13 GHVQ01018322.1:678-2510(+)
MIFTGSLISGFLNIRKRHPLHGGPIINLDIVKMIVPSALAGTFVGVYLNGVLSPIVIVILLFILLSAVTCRTFYHAICVYKIEVLSARQPAFTEVYLPDSSLLSLSPTSSERLRRSNSVELSSINMQRLRAADGVRRGGGGGAGTSRSSSLSSGSCGTPVYGSVLLMTGLLTITIASGVLLHTLNDYAADNHNTMPKGSSLFYMRAAVSAVVVVALSSALGLQILFASQVRRTQQRRMSQLLMDHTQIQQQQHQTQPQQQTQQQQQPSQQQRQQQQPQQLDAVVLQSVSNVARGRGGGLGLSASSCSIDSFTVSEDERNGIPGGSIANLGERRIAGRGGGGIMEREEERSGVHDEAGGGSGGSVVECEADSNSTVAPDSRRDASEVFSEGEENDGCVSGGGGGECSAGISGGVPTMSVGGVSRGTTAIQYDGHYIKEDSAHQTEEETMNNPTDNATMMMTTTAVPIWSTAQCILYPSVSFIAGVCSGLLGIGGGLIFSPFLVMMHIDPIVTVASAATCVIFTSSSTTFQYFLIGRVKVFSALVYGTATTVASYLGVRFVHWVSTTFGRKSYVIFIVAVAVGLSSALTIAKAISMAVSDLFGSTAVHAHEL